MARCLFPDCSFSPDEKTDDEERLKRLVIDHINHDHDEAHVIIPCSHDMQEQERFVATAVRPNGTKVELPQIRLQCSRCGQFEVRDDEPTVPGDAMPEIVAEFRKAHEEAQDG